MKDTSKKAQEELSLEKDLLQGLLDNIPDAVYFKDLSNSIIRANKFYVKGMGLDIKEIIGKTDFDFFPYDQAKQMFEDDKSVLATGRPIVGKIERTLLPNGTWNQVITTKIPMYDKTGKSIGTMGITRDMTTYANLERERITMLINALTILGKALELRDPYTFSHTRHVASIAESIVKVLGWDENRLLGMRLAGELHDLGKISIPLDILNKPGKLSRLEYCLIQEHVVNCYNLIKDIEFPFPLAEIVYQHHERLDGSGYPRKLKGDKIIQEARILAVSDVLEAMTHYRPYREALGIDKAQEELEEGMGLKYDSKVVEVVFKLIKENGRKVFWVGQQATLLGR
ncbi:MAG: HD domain-containing protein [Candidatus Omnitrophica bacterium]|nr:HD domain-containing protein [Candidatus Omnitrophota bacterium]MBU0897130.1 HD domain-containing protein [Candidatus Omnitrophota bacterium]MBU1133568.1 HD domain-containing protein [Candidatus Omnitrophota bacterium]MBU1366769.1 HD domain-containing protein [Candidatus Omnitrophota bacterium]MBU1524176.1 HD domain-containing protein [Candidatus Omnitrophota bacterium]